MSFYKHRSIKQKFVTFNNSMQNKSMSAVEALEAHMGQGIQEWTK